MVDRHSLSSLSAPSPRFRQPMSSAYQLLNPSVPGGPDKRKVAYFYDGPSLLAFISRVPTLTLSPQTMSEPTPSTSVRRVSPRSRIVAWLAADLRPEGSPSDETSPDQDGAQPDHKLRARPAP